MVRKNRKNRRGMTLMEILIVVAIIMIILAMAVPKINSARMSAQEMAAIRAIQTIHTAQTQYYSQFGRFAKALEELGPPKAGAIGPTAADLIQENLATGETGGYRFLLQTTPTGYSINANPVVFGSTGRRTFFSDQSMAIRENWSQEPADVNSPQIK